jgi:hypothetical protein
MPQPEQSACKVLIDWGDGIEERLGSIEITTAILVVIRIPMWPLNVIHTFKCAKDSVR